MMKMSKRILAVLLALLLPLLLAVPALALDSYELFARWEQDGYPEDCLLYTSPSPRDS